MKYYVAFTLVLAVFLGSPVQAGEPQMIKAAYSQQLDNLVKAMKHIFYSIGVNKTTLCPVTFVRLETGCYKYVQTELTWLSASYVCKSWGTRLLTIETKAENDVLERDLLDKYEAGKFWTGGNDMVKEAMYMWEALKQPMAYTAWHNISYYDKGVYKEKPGPILDKEESALNCVYMTMHYLKLRWGVAKCQKKYRFVCEKKPIK